MITTTKNNLFKAIWFLVKNWGILTRSVCCQVVIHISDREVIDEIKRLFRNWVTQESFVT